MTPTYVGDLPEQLAALNRTNINTQLLTIEAAMLDPHTAAELSIDDIVEMCDELIEAHGDYLPKFK
ncbi:Glyco-hydro-4C domain-containing protein [Sporosarcina sp. ANT_H38]